MLLLIICINVMETSLLIMTTLLSPPSYCVGYYEFSRTNGMAQMTIERLDHDLLPNDSHQPQPTY